MMGREVLAEFTLWPDRCIYLIMSSHIFRIGQHKPIKASSARVRKGQVLSSHAWLLTSGIVGDPSWHLQAPR